MKYKLLALDLDGTLLDSNGKLPQKHIEAVRKAQEVGVNVVIATGRYYMQTEWIIDKLDFKGIVVLNDGAITIKADTKEILHEFSYPIHEVAPIISICRKHDIHFSICTAFDYYVEFMDEYFADRHKQYGVSYTIHQDVLQLKDNVLKFSVDDHKKRGGWQNTIPLPTTLKARVDVDYFKEFVHSESSKTNGLMRVLNLLGIKSSEMMAIGDFYNDLDMIEYAGLGIAMGNAPEDIKQKANETTLSNDEDGVYHAIEKHILRP